MISIDSQHFHSLISFSLRSTENMMEKKKKRREEDMQRPTKKAASNAGSPQLCIEVKNLTWRIFTAGRVANF